MKYGGVFGAIKIEIVIVKGTSTGFTKSSAEIIKYILWVPTLDIAEASVIIVVPER